MDQHFDGLVALVTGASAGIGRATALAFAQAGAQVVVADVDVNGGEETAAMARENGHEAIFIRTDVSNSEAVKSLVDQTLAAFGRLDHACNNAGIEGVQALTADYPEDAWNRVIAVNLTGVWQCMRYEIPPMLRQGVGAIVNVASVLGVVGIANDCAYTASKHGIVGLTQAAALEYAAKGIRVNAVCPGFIGTPMLERAGLLTDPTQREMLIGLHPVKRLGTSEEVAEAILWLSSGGASFITGTTLLVDGGYTAQ